jgi:hydrogenase nickel incorporation protein HypA/HybF
MHETSLMVDLLRKVEAILHEHHAKRVLSIKVRLGALSHFSPEHFREHFEIAARRTSAEHANLEIVLVGDINDPHAQDVMIENVEVEK